MGWRQSESWIMESGKFSVKVRHWTRDSSVHDPCKGVNKWNLTHERSEIVVSDLE